ncbi:YcgL domain-containing protein [Thioalkalivibrio sulfidiphilus]|uniref:YcgL domain-containing protein Tgr7_3126 n=1 Tax=Thioalkalivibrio sulfidiphilus (strain HL-EbGR7) TaxID=396588 RepID=Y3126_THISH|nr:YcgL domain-containing protein [Thioalkalivibrio sulfidiphilus]B8GQ48.1 RecName: Full=YcgL domain-containing protein Tgr7_3126 [Thioalkalivibrio sulfidiphilus HL-EbGr7]ACL74195.1 protein of unknown function DUF709 [Thioalkalivibrio sulfidiphilus HL-EbGr7]
MQVYVYKSRRKPDTYIYLARKDDFEVIPAPLKQVFGTPEFTLEFELTPERTLAQEDPESVLASLRERGFHLQMPPQNERPL